jgi:hypothetical protein
MKLSHVESRHVLELDEKSGLPRSITIDQKNSPLTIAIESKFNIEIGGHDRRNPVGGLEYYETEWSSEVAIQSTPYLIQNQDGVVWAVPVKIGPVNAEITYCFNRIGPAVSIGVNFLGAQEIVVRNLVADISCDLGGGTWLLNIPGNGAKSDLPLAQLKTSTGISPMGGLRGSSGLIFLADSSADRNVAIWADGNLEIPDVEIVGVSASKAGIKIKSEFCSDLKNVRDLPLRLFSIDLTVPCWQEFPNLFQSWLDQYGVTSPSNPPDWVKPTMIFEAQLGYSIFGRVNTYGPYPTATDLINDLDRVKKLGFSCIQLMPRQPYPSYNVHDYWDIDTSYGDKAEIKRLVQEAHARGIKVIFDVLLHGVLDKESITTAADGVRSGPYKDRIDEKTFDSFSSDVKDSSNYYIAWSRHIIDFEDAWRDGSPAVSPLIEEHPEWFYRDAQGKVTGVYTKAFDARSASWQEYFMSAMLFLVEELDIDGFRFDAPTYNEYPNWADWASGRANASAIACVGLFQKLRPRVKALKPDALMYTEPSGHLLRKSMDLNYNYDEQWLVTSLVSKEARSLHGITNGKDLALWMKDRDALLPRGSMTAHHIDSHDTFWWPSWGIKWRREQFGLKMTQLLNCIFGALPGPFMMFVGGEEGIEDILPKVAAFKQRDEYRLGEHHWWVEKSIPDELFGISYQLREKATSVIVNPSNSMVKVNLNSWRESVIHESLVGSAIIRENELVIESQSAVILKHHLS